MKKSFWAGLFLTTALSASAQITITIAANIESYYGIYPDQQVNTPFTAVIHLDQTPYLSYPILQYYHSTTDFSFDGMSFLGRKSETEIFNGFVGNYGFISQPSSEPFLFVEVTGYDPSVIVDGTLSTTAALSQFDVLKSVDVDEPDFGLHATVTSISISDSPVNPGAVPEPATYGLIGGSALLGLIARKRFGKAV